METRPNSPKSHKQTEENNMWNASDNFTGSRHFAPRRVPYSIRSEIIELDSYAPRVINYKY